MQIGQEQEHPIKEKDEEESTAYSLIVDKLAQSFGAIGYHVNLLASLVIS
jgi:hypothetical protein